MSIESHRAMQVIEIPKDSTATVIEFTVVNDGAAVDISTATGMVFNTRTIDGVQVDDNVAATFTTTGADGKLDCPVSAATVGTLRELIADVRYTIGGLQITSYAKLLRILPGGRP